MSKIANLSLEKLALTGFQFHTTTTKTIQDNLQMLNMFFKAFTEGNDIV